MKKTMANPLIKIPEFIPQVGFLKGDFGKAFLKKYMKLEKIIKF